MQSGDLSLLKEPKMILPLVALGVMSLLPVALDHLKKKKGAGDENINLTYVIYHPAGGLSVGLGHKLGSTVLFERDLMGEDCLNTDCQPSKALLLQ